MNVAPGELTDDSRMMIDLAETLIQPGTVDMHALGRRFVAWMNENPKDIGNTTRIALEALRDGMDWIDAGQVALARRGAGGAASNGSVMRCAPVANRYHAWPEQLRACSINTSRITHAEPRCVWSCVALNQAIAHALRGGNLADLIEAARVGVEQSDVVSAIEQAPHLLELDLDGSGYVLNALTIAFWAVLTKPTFEEAVVGAVMIGDDTDTNAAVTAALAGAVHGYAQIPERWRTKVHQHERLVKLADQLLAVEPGA
jgi:ADP-ribosyl-[dinitrogen reductase] hydrolase